MPTGTNTVRATVPAKLNLGLAIVGRRDDGFHELVTIMQTITLCDRLTLTRRPLAEAGIDVALAGLTSASSGVAIDDPGLVGDDNLAVRAVALTCLALRADGEYRLALEKGIPAASGLGGGSADAAATIVITERAANLRLSDEERLRIAAELGSDVPFFLTGGSALVTGRGEHVEVLPAVGPTSFIVVSPRLATPISGKTARLFGGLVPGDFDAGAGVRVQADRIRAGMPLDPDLLGNGFSKALQGLAPELADLREEIAEVTGQPVALSGAGPTHYVVEPDSERADRSVALLRDALGARALVARCEPWDGPAEIMAVGSGSSPHSSWS